MSDTIFLYLKREGYRMKKLTKLGLVSTMAVSMMAGCSKTEAPTSDLEAVQKANKLVVGITDFAPMDYKNEIGDWIGFDADLATEFAKELGVEVEFTEIDWDNKVLELEGNTVDCIWNGMTLTDEVTSSMDCSIAYCNNAQVVIVNKAVADKYQDTDSIKELSFAVEAGSAGAEQAQVYELNYTEVSSQANALMEVAAGTSDAAIIDSLMAAAMVGEGTSYSDLTYTVQLNEEKYGVGFRKNSDLVDKLNDFLKASYENGTTLEIAKKYGVQASLIEM